MATTTLQPNALPGKPRVFLAKISVGVGPFCFEAIHTFAPGADMIGVHAPGADAVYNHAPGADLIKTGCK